MFIRAGKCTTTTTAATLPAAIHGHSRGRNGRVSFTNVIRVGSSHCNWRAVKATAIPHRSGNSIRHRSWAPHENYVKRNECNLTRDPHVTPCKFICKNHAAGSSQPHTWTFFHRGSRNTHNWNLHATYSESNRKVLQYFSGEIILNLCEQVNTNI